MSKFKPNFKLRYSVDIRFFDGNKEVFHECTNCETTINFLNVSYIDKHGSTVTEAFHISTVKHVTIVSKEIST